MLQFRVHMASSVPGSVVTPTFLTHLGPLISNMPMSWVVVKVKCDNLATALNPVLGISASYMLTVINVF